ncbi:MAG: M48 family metalloprotease [Bacteroidales bacterium]|nr:M48 family metalloprotease [Bacteroidales bacterium]
MPRYYERKGYNLSIRRELMDDASDYLDDLAKLFYTDEYIQDYILTVFNSTIPRHLDDRRPERVVVEILKSPNPDAQMLPNGTLLLTTGLLSVLDSVEELTAIIVSEVAHYVLDHQVVNLVKERTKLRRAAIWSASLQLIASGVDLALTLDRRDNYIPGSIVVDVGVVTHEVISLAIGHFGMGYSDRQAYDADDIALRFLIRNGMDPSALGSALRKIEMYYIEAKDETVFTQEGGYANLNYRIGRLGHPVMSRDFNYLKKMSVVTTANDMMQLNSKNYWAAEKLAQKNIDNQLGTYDDYFVLIKANMGYASSQEDNEKNLKRIRKIINSTSFTHLGLSKLEVLLLLRLDREEEAIQALDAYLDQVLNFKQQNVDEFDSLWANEEIGWGNGLYRQLQH